MTYKKHLGIATLILLAAYVLPAQALDKVVPAGVQIPPPKQIQAPTQVKPVSPLAPVTPAKTVAPNRAAGKMNLPRLFPYVGCAQINTSANEVDIKLKGINLERKYRYWTRDKQTRQMVSHWVVSHNNQELQLKIVNPKAGSTIVAEVTPSDFVELSKVLTQTEIPICAAAKRLPAGTMTKNQKVVDLSSLQKGNVAPVGAPSLAVSTKKKVVTPLVAKSQVSKKGFGSNTRPAPVLTGGGTSRGAVYKAIVSYEYAQRIKVGNKMVSQLAVREFQPIKSLEGGPGAEQQPDIQPIDGAIDPSPDQAPSAADCPPGEPGCPDIVDNSGGGVTDPPEDWVSNTTVNCPGGMGAACEVVVKVNPLGEPSSGDEVEMEEFCASNTGPVDFGCGMIEMLANVDPKGNPMAKDGESSDTDEAEEDPCDGGAKEGDCADCADPDGDGQCGTAEKSDAEDDSNTEEDSKAEEKASSEGQSWDEDGNITVTKENKGGGTTTTEGEYLGDGGETSVYTTTFSDDTDMTDLEKRADAEADSAEAHSSNTGGETSSSDCNTMYEGNGVWTTVCN